jgi:hypothetical protein
MELGRAYAEVLPASHRHALADAADFLTDTTFRDFSSNDYQTWTNSKWYLGSVLPPRYESRCDLFFAQQLFVCLLTVVWKLGQRDHIGPSCVAEELAAHILIEEAARLLKEEGIEAEFGPFEDWFFEDVDFEYLYVGAYDGIETSEIAEVMGIGYLAFGDWFIQFGDPEESTRSAVHPYVRHEEKADRASGTDANRDANPDDIE